MANLHLRFSGWHIPIEYWNDYPCWEFAVDEERREGQDETTMRPCDEPRITKHTDVVAANAISMRGDSFPAIVSLSYPDRSPNGILIYVDGKFGGRVVEFSMRHGMWTEYESNPSWYPAWTSGKSERGFLPVKIVTLATSDNTGVPLSFTVNGF